jgi:hypothetical protein
MRILLCGAMLLALIGSAFATPMTPIPHKSGVTKAGSCHTHCYWIGNSQHCDTNCY